MSSSDDHMAAAIGDDLALVHSKHTPYQNDGICIQKTNQYLPQYGVKRVLNDVYSITDPFLLFCFSDYP